MFNVKRTPFLVLAFIFQALTPVALAEKSAASKELYFGSVAMATPAVMHPRLLPLTEYLSEALQRPVNLKLAFDTPTAIKEVSDNAVHLAYLAPAAYIEAKNRGDVRLIAKAMTKEGGSFQLMVVTKQDSPIRGIQDLAGKRFAFGDKAAVLQRAVVIGAGMPLERLGSYVFIGDVGNVVSGVMNGDFDAGILKDTIARKWEGKGLKILHASSALPPFNIAASRNMDANLLAQVRGALLKLNVRNPEHAKILQALDEQYTGFAPVKDREYDIVRKLIESLEKGAI